MEGIDFVPIAQSTLSISDDPVIKSEGDSGATVFTFAITLSDPIGSNVVVQVDTANGSGTTADNDYTDVSQQVTFTPGGSLTQNINVLVTGDTKVEPDKDFTVGISLDSGSNIVLGNTTATGTILNDDSVTVDVRQLGGNGATLPEGDSGTTGFSFEVAISNPISSDVVVQVNTVDGSATDADNDYEPLSQTITFTPGGSLTQSFDVLVNGDTTVEPDEDFSVDLNLVSGDGSATGAILNDDDVTIDINEFGLNSADQDEGNIGPTSFTFEVTLSDPITSDVQVRVMTQDGTATIHNDDNPLTLAAPTIMLLDASDTLPLGDGITSVNESAFKGTGAEGTTVILFANGEPVG